MAKTNFSKVENALSQGLMKLNVQHILDLADAAAAVGQKSTLNPKNSTDDTSLQFLEKELTRLHKKDKDLYKKLNLNGKQLKNYFRKPNSLSSEDWKYIEEIKEKLAIYRKKTKQEQQSETDADLVERERKRHKTKRFNTNEKWLPLDLYF